MRDATSTSPDTSTPTSAVTDAATSTASMALAPGARPTAPEPRIAAADLPDPVGPLAAPTHLRLDQYLPGDVLGGASGTPRLSWEVATAPEGWQPTAAELEITRTALDATPLPEGGCPNPTTLALATADGILAAWPAAPLASRERVSLRVRVTGTTAPATSTSAPATTATPAPVPSDGGWSPWSDPIAYEAGLLVPEDWQALPVGPAWPENPASDRRPPRVRTEFTIDHPVVAARLRTSAHGLVRAELDGQRVGADELVPGWTVYGTRLVARTYDVTQMLRSASPTGDGVGEHALGAQLADGWYRGHIGFDGGYRNLYGPDVAAILQLELTHPDGSTTTLASGEGWQAGAGEILFTGLYEGESVDARLADPAWSQPGLVGRTRPANTIGPDGAPLPDGVALPDGAPLPGGWSPAAVGAGDAERLVMPTDEPVRVVETLAPVSVTRLPDPPAFLPEVAAPAEPRFLVDLGQNIAGRLRLRVSGPAGTTITLRHAEVLDDGELATRPLREAAATDTYVLAGPDSAVANRPGGVPGVEQWEPTFTVHGFRYAEVTGWPGDPATARREIEQGGVLGVVVHTDMERLGAFDCSDELVTRLHENSRWSMRDNFVAIPTDCPQRDERLGWTGDIQAFTPTAAFHYGCAGILGSWLTDLAIEQDEHGTVPWYVPVIPGGFWTPPRPAAVWGDAATVVPWELYRATGDRGLLHAQWESASGWVDLVDSLAGEGHVWDSGLQLGDWLDPAAPPDDPMQALTDRYLVATAFFARSARVVALWAAELGRDEDARRYGDLADAVGEAFRARYTDGQGRMTSHSQTAYALAIAFDLCGSAVNRERAGAFLADLVEASGGHVSTGFAGTPVLASALSATGHDDAAYRLLLTRTCPSWLYAVTMGATTTWERWDSMLPDGSINPGGMTSFNHYALGAVAQWLQRAVGGLAPAEAGYRVIEVAPRPGGGLTRAESVHRTPHGWAAVSWRLAGADGVEVAPEVALAWSVGAREGVRLEVDVVVPVGASARVVLPGHAPVVVGHGRHHLST